MNKRNFALIPLLMAALFFTTACGGSFSGVSSSTLSSRDDGDSGLYVPFTSKDPLPASLEETYSRLSVERYRGTTLRRLSTTNHDLFFDSRIAALMETAAQFNTGDRVPASFLCEFESTLNQIGALNSPRSVAILEAGNLACLRIHQPETFFRQGTPFREGLLNMLDLEDLIGAVVTPSLQRETPFSFFDRDTTRQIRAAFLRLRFDDLIAQLNELDSRVTAALGDAGIGNAERDLLTTLQGRVRAQRQAFQQWNEQGRTTFAADTARIGQANKNRGGLPYTNMPDSERKALTMYLFAMMWRFRGGGFVALGSTQSARFYFAQAPYSILADLNGADTTTALTLGANMFANLALLGWGEWMDMGRTPNQNSEVFDLVNMSDRGLFQTASIESTLGRQGYNTNITRFYSLQFGICYLAAWDRLEDVYVERFPSGGLASFFDGPTAWAELCAGAAFGLGLAETLLAGR